jgi:exopolysaccharide biosynthesis polyprenyl glycosylphosphotransferase
MRREFLLQGLKWFDTLVVALAAGAAGPVPMRPGLELLLFLLLCRSIFERLGLYRSWRLESRAALAGQIAKAVAAAALLALVWAIVEAWPVRQSRFAPAFWTIGLLAILCSRLVLYRVLGLLREHGHNLRTILIVGAGPRGTQFAATLESQVDLGYHVAGFLDEGPTAAEAGPRLLGGFAALESLLHTGRFDEVAILLPLRTFYETVCQMVSLCERQGVVVRLPADLFEARFARLESEQVGGLEMLTLFTGPASEPSLAAKRALDILLSVAALVLLAPLYGGIALAVRLGSAGPAFFTQVRVGRHGHRFRMVKFRTMVADAEGRQAGLEDCNEVRGAAFKIRNDPRITRQGRWLRRSSLDELPQLVNILWGDMSLVGPRPLPLRDVSRMREQWQRRRFAVRPGLTCLWQSGGRHRLNFEQWMQLDLDYIDNWSLLLDLRILARTVPAVITGAGAA